MTPFQDRTKKLAERLVSTLDKIPKEPSPKYVHRLRTAIRRIESLASYAQPGLGRKQQKALKEMAVLRKRAGKVRDLDVQRDLLKEIANGSAAADRRTLSDALQRKREKQAGRLVSNDKKIVDSKFLSQIGKISDRAAASDVPGRPDPFAEAASRLAKLEGEFTAHGSHSPAELHQVRIETKRIRYIAELADETPEQQGLVERLRSAQDALGSWHDWQELAKSAEKQFRQRTNCPLLVEIRALLAAKQSTARAAVHRLFAKQVAPVLRRISETHAPPAASDAASPQKIPPTSAAIPKRSRSVVPARELARRAG